MHGHGPFLSLEDHKHTQTDALAKQFNGYVPIVVPYWGMICELDVLFLRAEPIEGLMNHSAGGGDIDNRMKTLLDSLSIPRPGQQSIPDPADPDPDPMFVLLADDSLITSVKVSTGRLLTVGNDNPSEACVIIHVNVKGMDASRFPYGLNI